MNEDELNEFFDGALETIYQEAIEVYPLEEYGFDFDKIFIELFVDFIKNEYISLYKEYEYNLPFVAERFLENKREDY